MSNTRLNMEMSVSFMDDEVVSLEALEEFISIVRKASVDEDTEMFAQVHVDPNTTVTLSVQWLLGPEIA